MLLSDESWVTFPTIFHWFALIWLKCLRERFPRDFHKMLEQRIMGETQSIQFYLLSSKKTLTTSLVPKIVPTLELYICLKFPDLSNSIQVRLHVLMWVARIAAYFDNNGCPAVLQKSIPSCSAYAFGKNRREKKHFWIIFRNCTKNESRRPWILDIVHKRSLKVSMSFSIYV